ncbi:LysE family translocator [Psychromonas sp. psych-6C06]|uniref:LysE family translocator n=1 Tax=Psychromonas sp. psych-6C06 TaxID=2058089 RepID=UPI001930E43E|nr:LysE family translocator [Psychromonas sp. psych-6C06]
MESSLLLLFLVTFFAVSVTPGLCMTLSLTLGMTIGIKRSLWMIVGELIGVGLVALAALLGVATLLLTYPSLFVALKYGGGAYLCYLGVQMWRSKGKMAIDLGNETQQNVSALSLAVQGFVTAIANPKGWVFMISLLPPFINTQQPLLPQASVLIAIILVLELICLLLYASGGRALRRLLEKKNNVQLMNRIAGTMMLGVALWLVVG